MSDPSSPLSGPSGFANPDAVATPEWLMQRLDDPSIRIVDTRYIIEVDENGRFFEVPGRESFVEGHIPGAVFLGLDDLRDAEAPTRIVVGDTFAEIMCGLGVGNDDEIVVYDTEGGAWAARLWWALRMYGHERVRILDGGLRWWNLEGLPVEAGDRIVAPGTFTAEPAGGLRVEVDEVIAAMDEPGAVIVDALSEPFHAGRTRLYASLRAGHIPGAVNVPAPDNFDADTHRLLPAATLSRRWERVIDGADRIITYCGGGMYGAFDLFVLHLLGYDAVLYDGAWEEWAADEQLPIATSPPGLPDERLGGRPIPRAQDGT
jgi:thiosulfate/3-mercaptopyruvate sulfurtransferase